MPVGRGCCKGRVPWEKLEVQSTVNFHWLSYGHLQLAELALGKEQSFLPSAEVIK